MHRHVVDETRVDHHVAADAALDALPAQTGPGGDPLGLVVVRGHHGLDAVVVDEGGRDVTSYDVDGGLPPALGQVRRPVDAGDPVGHRGELCVGLVGHGITLVERRQVLSGARSQIVASGGSVRTA